MNTKVDTSIQKVPIWQCPICQHDLVKQEKQFLCVNQHSFDVAKEGYVNLLLAHQKKSKIPGDNKEMVNARHDFLNKGHYAPLVGEISRLLIKAVDSSFSSLPDSTLNQKTTYNVFDAGCGEGYYLRQVYAHLQDYIDEHKHQIEVLYSGVDISKFAIQKAAKLHKQHRQIGTLNNQHDPLSTMHFSVASTYKLPVKTESKDAIIQVFAPSDINEVYRVLKKGGVYVLVTPAPKHLFDMKRMIYDHPETHQEDQSDMSLFNLAERSSSSFSLALDTEIDRLNLLMMTPFFWTISEDKKAKLLRSLKQTEVDFDVKVFHKS